MGEQIFIEADSIVAKKMSGIGHTVLEIIRALDELAASHDLHVTLIVPWGMQQKINNYGFRHMRVKQLPPGRRIVNYLLTSTNLPLAVDRWFGRGIYLFPDYKNWYVPSSRSITIIYDLVFRKHPETVHPEALAYLKKNFPKWLARADVLVTISRSSASELAHYYPAHRAKVKPVLLGVDPTVFYRRPTREIQQLRETYKLPEHYFLFVGNLEPRKNLGVLLEAYKLYSDDTKHPWPLLLVGGDGWNNQAIKAKLRALQTQHYAIHQPTSYIPDAQLPALYSGAAALVHVAIHEGFGLPPVQAQACGTPVIVSDLPVFHETLRPKSTTFLPNTTPATLAFSLATCHGGHFAGDSSLTWAKTARTLLAAAGVELDERTQ